MSRSFRHSPFTGHTTAESEKKDKRLANRRERRVVQQKLSVFADDSVLPHRRSVSNPYSFDKDGKQRLSPELPDYAKLMRK